MRVTASPLVKNQWQCVRRDDHGPQLKFSPLIVNLRMSLPCPRYLNRNPIVGVIMGQQNSSSALPNASTGTLARRAQFASPLSHSAVGASSTRVMSLEGPAVNSIGKPRGLCPPESQKHHLYARGGLRPQLSRTSSKNRR